MPEILISSENVLWHIDHVYQTRISFLHTPVTYPCNYSLCCPQITRSCSRFLPGRLLSDSLMYSLRSLLRSLLDCLHNCPCRWNLYLDTALSTPQAVTHTPRSGSPLPPAGVGYVSLPFSERRMKRYCKHPYDLWENRSKAAVVRI
jgi:hypothetical protein